MSQQPIAIAYLPWADLEDEFAIGPVSFWPFHVKAAERITDATVRNHLARFFETFVDNVGKPVQTVVAVSIGDVQSRAFTDEEYHAIASAVDCLIFAAIACGAKNGVCANNSSMGPPSADRFDLCARWIWPTEQGIVVKTENSLGYWSCGQYKITQPISLGGSFLGSFQPLLEGLGCAFSNEFPIDVWERLLRTLEWFRFAHTESTAVSWPHKVVMMATAFEIFLEFPERGQTAYFAEQIDERLRLEDSIFAKRTDKKDKEHEACLAAWWARDFYHLRSRIVHGDTVTASDFLYKDWITHLIVADLVLLELVKRMLYEQRCIGDDLRRTAAEWAQNSDDSVEEFERVLLPGMLGLGLDDVHEAFGWIPPLAQRKKRHEEQHERDDA